MKMTLFKTLIQFMLVGGAHAQQTNPLPQCSITTVKALEPRFFKEERSQRQAITYGPFSVPGMSDHHGMKEFRCNMSLPCSDCFVTHAQADLQYPNGSYANVNTGMWLHHVAIVNLRPAIVCPTNAEILFASGNERVPANICVNGTQRAGYYIAPGTQPFVLLAELMNDRDEAREATVVMDWEFVPNTPGFKQANVLWLDIDGACTTRGSEVPVPGNGATKVFSLSMTPPFKATFSADILQIISHVHDGGESLQVTRNGATVCDSVAKYGESEGYISTSIHEHGGSSGSGTGTVGRAASKNEKRAPAHTTKTPHVSSINSCFLPKDKIQPGDEWSIKANYNLTDHKAMGDGSGLAPIMGISMVYIVKN